MAQIYNAGNDFVAAFSAGLRDRLAQQEETRQAQESAMNQKFRDTQLKLLTEGAAREAEKQKMEIDLNRMNLENQLRQQFLSGARRPTEFEISGYSPEVKTPESLKAIGIPDLNIAPQATMSPTRTQTAAVPKSFSPEGRMTIEGLNFPKDLQQMKMEDALSMIPVEALREGIKANAKLPGQLAVVKEQGEQQRKTEEVKSTNAVKLEETRNTNKLAQIEKTVEGQKVVAGIRAAATRYAADVKANSTHKVDEQAIADTATMAATGQADVTGLSNNAMAARSLLKSQGYVPFLKKDADKLKAVHDVDVLQRDMEEIFNRLPTSRTGAAGQLFLSKIPASEWQNIKNLIKSRAANISHTVGGEIGRLSDPDIERAMGIMLAPGITQEEAFKRMRSWKAEYANKIMNNILGGQSNKQKLLNMVTYGFDPEAIGGFTKVGGKTYTTFKKDENGEYLYLDPKAKQYKALDE